jgi:hypothetical protein
MRMYRPLTNFVLQGFLRIALVLLLSMSVTGRSSAADEPIKRYLYVAVPGVRDYLEYGGHGLIVFDIDDDYKFVKRIRLGGLRPDGRPMNIKGICGSAVSGKLYISTLKTMMCLDMAADSLRWERTYADGCDRMSITPDGQLIFLPSLEGPHWYVVDADGHTLRKLVRNSGAHNTIVGLSGKQAYLAGLRSPLLSVASTSDDSVRTVGPFSNSIRPFTVNGAETRCFVNVNELLGFEVGDLISGKRLHRVEVQGFSPGPVKRHGCPSHGVGLTPDEKQIWVTDAHNRRMHVFDNTVSPPKQMASIELHDEPGWIAFSMDGRHAWPSTGDIVDVATHEIVAQLADEEGRGVQSEKMLEVHMQAGKPIWVGNQFAIGRVTD